MAPRAPRVRSLAPDSRATDLGFRSVLLNTTTSYGRHVIEIVTLLVLTPFLLENLGREAYGLWALISAYIGLLALVDCGLGIAVVKLVADARGRNDEARLRAVVCTVFWLYAALGAFLLLLALGSLLFFNSLFDIPVERREAARATLLLLASRSALCFPLGTFQGVLVGSQQGRVVNGYRAVALLAYLVTVLAVISHSPDVRWLALINLVIGVLSMSAMLLHARAGSSTLRLHPRWFDRGLVTSVLTYSLSFLVFQITALASTRVDSIIIQSTLSLEDVATYAVALGLATHGYLFCIQAARALTPVMAELHGSGEKARIREIWSQATRYSVAFATPLLVGLAVLAEPMILSWTGAEFAAAIPACQWLALAMILEVVHGNTFNVLGMTGGHRRLAGYFLLQQVVNIGITVALTMMIGIRGAAIATFITLTLIHVGFIQRDASARYGYPMLRFYREALGPILLPSAVLVAFLLSARALLAIDRVAEVAALEAIAAVIFWCCYARVGLTSEERQALGNRLRTLVRPGRRAETGEARDD